MKANKLLSLAAIVLAQVSFGQTLVTSLADMSYTDQIVWTNLAAVNTTALLPTSLLSNGGQSVSVSSNVDIVGVLSSATTPGLGLWNGNFAMGEAVIFNRSMTELTINPALDIYSLGLGLQSDIWGEFEGTMELYSSTGELLKTFTIDGLSNNIAGTASFLGFTGDVLVDYVKVYVNSGNSSFAIGTAYMSTTAVPEPSTYGLMGAAGLLGIAAYRRRQAAKK